jgi:hypothetical protein
VLKPDGNSPWRTLLFGQNPETVEMPNIRMIEIDRTLGADAASMQMTILNLRAPTADDILDDAWDGGTSPTRRELKDLGKPGPYTFRRGIAVDDSGLNRWAHDIDATWVDMLIPNRVIQTFQGYGTDFAGTPSDDTKLTLTGIWLIDSVEYKADATILISCRDAAKLLIEQRLYPPIIPIDNYPLEFCADHIDISVFQAEDIVASTTTGVTESLGPNVANFLTSGYRSSNTPWYGVNGSIYGHRASHAFDGDESTYWLSVGNSGPSVGWAFEWIGADTRGEPINQVRFKQKWGGYKVYIGVKVNGVWQGSSTVPYASTSKPAYPNGSNIKYVKSLNTPRNNNWITVDLPATYNADEIRVVFTNLADSNLGTYQYRAAVYELRAYHFQPSTVETVTTTTTPDPVDVETFVPGNVDDYVDIVKLFCAWSGFFWPNAEQPDPLLDEWYEGTNGRVWGDFFQSGAFPVDPPCIDPSYWDNKSVQDGINQIKEILGFIFYIDSSGGAVFRPPNIWKTGNFVQGLGYVGYDSLRTIDETKVLMDYGVTIDDENLRSEVIVVSADDPSVYGVFTPGFAIGETAPETQEASGAQGAGYEVDDLSLLAGQQRPMLVPDYPFGTADDPNAAVAVAKFAYLVSLWIHWSYRTSSFRIPGMPAFEPDDQVRIYERTTSEVYVHYIQGLRSTMDLESGSWTMDIDTHWLGNGPDSTWLVNARTMHPALFAYLRAIGQIPDEVENDESKWPDDWFLYEQPVITEPYPRVDEDYGDLFPLPPGLEWPSNDIDWETGDGYPDYTVPPDSTGGDGSGGGTGNNRGGTALNCSNTANWAYWPNAGPPNRAPGSNWSSGDCNQSHLIWINFWTASSHASQTETIRLKVDERGYAAWLALRVLVSRHNYKVNRSMTGSYSCRPVKLIGGGYSTRNWSNHSWGLAIDINSGSGFNPHGTRATVGSTIYKIGIEAESLIRTKVGNHRVFKWGNFWSTPDPMHFQICATPQQIAGGVILMGSASGGSGTGNVQ